MMTTPGDLGTVAQKQLHLMQGGKFRNKIKTKPNAGTKISMNARDEILRYWRELESARLPFRYEEKSTSFKCLTTESTSITRDAPRYELQKVNEGTSTAALILFTSEKECWLLCETTRTKCSLRVGVWMKRDVLNNIKSSFNFKSVNSSTVAFRINFSNLD